MDILSEIIEAEKRIRPNILKTPLIESKELSNLIEGKVYLKMESEQYTGSFKARGSLNKILSLTEAERKKGVITASTGNHALGFANAMEKIIIEGTVYLPVNATKTKLKALENYPVDLKFHGTDCAVTEAYARRKAKEQNKIWISPYNDPKIIGGQGTIGIELTEQLDHFDSVFITIGGGGLISGIGTYLKNTRPKTKIIGCQPERSPEMALSLKAGKIVSLDVQKETLSDASAGGIEEGSITFPICQSLVKECLLATEEEIAAALKFVVHTHHKIIEGSAAVPIACLVKNKEKFKGSTIVIIICGANIDTDILKSII